MLGNKIILVDGEVKEIHYTPGKHEHFSVSDPQMRTPGAEPSSMLIRCPESTCTLTLNTDDIAPHPESLAR